jgi:multiple sugar transport system permease protein
MVSVNLLDTMWTFYLPAMLGTGIRSGLFIYIFRQFFRGMPKELEDAAGIDGCSHFGTFVRVMVPSAMPAFLTVFLFSFVWYWNDYFFSAMFFTSQYTISLRLAILPARLQQLEQWAHQGDPFRIVAQIQAGSLLAVGPVLVLYIVLQRYFTESIERTGIVG